jgi:nitroreductase
MDLYQAIERRRTVRVFKKRATKGQIRRIILAGSKAPSGGNRQPWEFIVIDGPRIIGKLGELKYQLNRKFTPDDDETQKDVEERARKQKTGFRHAAVVAVCTKAKEAVDGWLAVENMSLAAVAEGLGSNIVSYWGPAKKKAEKILGIPAGFELTCVLKLGVPGEKPRLPERRPDWSWLHKNTF